ncbi:MAG: DUF3786 domain-containing protein [Deltaproteobacteria bacterium]|nr:MAG: DUF3786 domain-containing protein [Deltaproteobacteria bacterium]
MPRIDDYKQALELGRRELSGKNPDLVASFSGAEIHADERENSFFSLHFLNKEIIISWPELEFSYKSSDEGLPIQQRILLLHYLYGAWSSSRARIKGEWISFQEVPDGKFYLDAFHRRAKNPMVQTFGERPELLVKLAKESFGAVSSDQGDVSVVIKALPLVPVALIIWKGDEEFPPEGNILFDRNIIEILSAEDMAWLSGMVVYPLVGMARK